MQTFKILAIYLVGQNCIATPATVQQHELSAPYNSLTTVLPVNNSPCWFGIGVSVPLTRELAALPGEELTVIEVGSFLGASAIFMAQQPRVKAVYAVDHWKGSPGFEKGPVAPMLPTLYEQFLSNVIHAGLTKVIRPVRKDSVEAARTLAVQADLIYIDADHTDEAVYSDLCAWYPKLKSHGVMCGDDWFAYTGVRSAVTRFAKERNLKIIVPDPVGPFWKLQA